jgi:TetR/AcrR family fatty acid metabolism transcriptional regulator
VETAIRTIAARGYSRTSLAEIAREAGISKGVISYHFAGKGELVEEILTHLLREPSEFIKKRVEACDSATDKLRAYISANFEMMQAHRDHYVALVDLWGSRESTEGRHHFDAGAYEPSRHYLSRILDAGRESGELRTLPVPTMAAVIQAAIDGVMLQWVIDAGAVELEAARDEILEMVARHVGNQEAGSAGMTMS